MYCIIYETLLLLIFFCQEDVTPAEAATEKGEVEPYLLVGNNQVFLVIDTEIVYELEKEDSALGLISSFFVFNIHYTKGCRNFFFVLEKLVLDISDKIPVSVSMFLSSILQST